MRLTSESSSNQLRYLVSFHRLLRIKTREQLRRTKPQLTVKTEWLFESAYKGLQYKTKSCNKTLLQKPQIFFKLLLNGNHRL